MKRKMPPTHTAQTVPLDQLNSLEQYSIPTSAIIGGKKRVDPKSEKEKKEVGTGELGNIIRSTRESAADSAGITELVPELALIREILIPSILSPTDMRKPTLEIFQSDDGVPGVAEAVKRHFTSVFNLEEKLPDILGKALFDNGSFPMMVISPKAINNLIQNNSTDMESWNVDQFFGHSKNIGLLNLSTGTEIAMESLNGYDKTKKQVLTETQHRMASSVSISDNPMRVFRNAVSRTIDSAERRAKLSDFLDLEAYGSTASGEADALETFFRRRVREQKRLVDIVQETTHKEGGGKKAEAAARKLDKSLSELNPLVYMPPHESVIPIHVPGEPEKRLGLPFLSCAMKYPKRFSGSPGT